MTEQKIQDINTQIEALLKLKELTIQETASVNPYASYDAIYKDKGWLATILKCDNINLFEYLVKEYCSDELLTRASLLFKKALKSKDLVFASSLFLSGHINTKVKKSRDYVYNSDNIALLILAINANDLDRLEMLIEVMTINYSIDNKLCYDTYSYDRWEKLTEYEIEKYKTLAIANDENDDEIYKTGEMIKIYRISLFKDLINSMPKRVPKSTFEFILEKNWCLTDKRYTAKYINIADMISSSGLITYDNCASLNISNIIAESVLPNFDYNLLHFVNNIIIDRDCDQLGYISERVDLRNLSGFISYVLNHTNDADFHKKALSTFHHNLVYGIRPEFWVGVDLKNVSMEFFAYYIGLIDNEDCEIEQNDVDEMILYLVSINREDLARQVVRYF